MDNVRFLPPCSVITPKQNPKNYALDPASHEINLFPDVYKEAPLENIHISVFKKKKKFWLKKRKKISTSYKHPLHEKGTYH